MKLTRGLLLSVSLCLWSCALSAAQPPATPTTVDSACPWGRLADGKGRLVRCLTQAESDKLRAESSPAPAGTVDAAPRPLAFPPGERPPSLANVVPAEPPPAPPPAEPPAETPPAEADALVSEITSISADTGTLPDAMKSLKKALDKFSQCAEKNGGLTLPGPDAKGEVELRFLVQGRGRAEGVSVKKRRGLGEAAAKCVAGVVDRRYVGSPEEPMVGATLQVVISKKKR